MATEQGIRLSQTLRSGMSELARICETLPEELASQSPPGRWSPKQIISHLSGPDGIGFMPAVNRILQEETPRIDIVAENPFFTDRRAAMSLQELLTECLQEYGRIADFLETASVDQLSRKAQIPLFRETPLGEYPTLEAFIGAIAGWHLDFHINHLREVLKAIGC